MYQDLKSKLALYKTGQVQKPVQPKDTGLDIHNLLQGSVCSNEDGSFFAIQKKYPLTYLYGGCSLGSALGVQMSTLQKLCPGMKCSADISELLFLDTETTGLSSGVGTVAFLIGTGFFEEDAFVLRQYFMKDYNEEPAVLRALNELSGRFKGLVTFNGKSFDWNLLQSRFTFSRMRPALKEPLHLDLLFPSRRIWKLKLESCRLSVLEESILGEYRTDDIPGAMIPSVYFKYLEDRNAGEIVKVVKHNELDILTMVSLLVRISAMIEDPMAETDGGHELLGVGRIFEASGEYDRTVRCFESCMKSDTHYIKDTASRRLSDIYKRNGNYQRAVEHWENMLSGPDDFNLFPMIELAKYYEHKEKNVLKALEIVERAMRRTIQLGFKNNVYFHDLKKRYERLRRKAEKTVIGKKI